MGLLNPWLLLALAALAVPVLVHLVQRDDAQAQGFPSLMFLRRVPYPLRRRRTLRDRTLLALRCLALTLLVLGFTAPYCSGPSAGGGTDQGLPDRVLLLDGSYSMEPHWEAALETARQQIESLAPGQRAALIRFEDQATVVRDLTPDHDRLRDALAFQRPGEGGTRFQAAFAAAGQLLADGGSRAATVVLISDLQTVGLPRGELPLNPNARLEVTAVGGFTGPNGAIMAAELLPGQGSERTLRVSLRNSGDAPLEDAALTLTVEGRPLGRQPLTLAPGQSRDLDLALTLPRERPVRITLSLEPDALAADNQHHLVLSGGRHLTVGLVEPDRRRADQGVYLEQALALLPQVGEVRRLKAGQLGAEALDDLDLLIVDDAPLPSGRDGETLQTFLTRGGGLLVVAGAALDGAWPEGDLPPRPGRPVTRESTLDLTQADHPLALAAGLSIGRAFSGVRVNRYRPLVPGEDDRVVLTLDDGAPLLVEHPVRGGRVLVLTTTLDPRWSTLALEPGFVPLVEALVDHLAGRHEPRDALILGETLDLARQAGALPGGGLLAAYLEGGGAAVIERPDGTSRRLEPGRTLYTPARVGLYEVHRADGGGAPLPFAVNGPRAESLLTALDPGELERRVRTTVSGNGEQVTATDPGEEPNDWGRRLLLLAALLLLLEGLLADRLSLGRRPQGPAH